MKLSNQNEEKHQHQKKRKEENRRKIMESLASHERIGFEELRRHANLSRRTLNYHLKRLKEDGYVRQGFGVDIDEPFGEKKYSLATPQENVFSTFGTSLYDFLDHLRVFNDPQDWPDKYGLAPFNPKEQKRKAQEIMKKSVDIFLYMIMKLTTFAKEGDPATEASWVRNCLEIIPHMIKKTIENYLDGQAVLVTDKGDLIKEYPGDKLVYDSNGWTTRINPIDQQLDRSFIMAEIERRRQVRSRYLIKEIEKIINHKNLGYFNKRLAEPTSIEILELTKELGERLKKQMNKSSP